MKSQRAAPSERNAPKTAIDREEADARRPDPGGSGASSSSSWLPLDARAGDVRGELLVLSDLIGDPVPTIGDGLLGPGLVQLPGEALGDGRVEHVPLVLLRLRVPRVEHHVLVLEGGLDGTKIVLGGSLAEAGGLPGLWCRAR